MLYDSGTLGGVRYIWQKHIKTYTIATSIFIHKRVKYEDLPSFSFISPLYLMPIAISITTTITTDMTDAITKLLLPVLIQIFPWACYIDDIEI